MVLLVDTRSALGGEKVPVYSWGWEENGGRYGIDGGRGSEWYNETHIIYYQRKAEGKGREEERRGHAELHLK